MLYNTHTFVYIHPTKKIVLLTTLRTGSSWCESNLTEEHGWKAPRTTLSALGLEGIQSLHEHGFKFYCAMKEPILRLTSAMEIVVSPVRDSNLDSLVNQEIFANSINLLVHGNACMELREHGTLNYNLGDAHMSWGTHVSALFLESLGIICQPLMLESTSLLPLLKPGGFVQNFNSFIRDLDLQHQDSMVAADKISLRADRFQTWLQICSRSTLQGRSGGATTTPSYTVFDWLGNDNYLYSTFLGMAYNNPPEVGRQQVAQTALLKVIDDMWSKLNIEGIFKGLPYRIKNNTIYPWDTMFDLMRLFMDRQSELPGFYDRKHCDNLFKLPDHYQFVVQKREISE